jgi:hypothetical protein
MVPPFVGFSFQVKGGILHFFYLGHWVKLEVSVQFMYPGFGHALYRPIEGWDIQPSYIAHQVIVLWALCTFIPLPRFVLLFEVAEVIIGNFLTYIFIYLLVLPI